LGFALLQRSAHPHGPSARLASGPRRKPIPLGDILFCAASTAARRPGGLHATFVIPIRKNQLKFCSTGNRRSANLLINRALIAVCIFLLTCASCKKADVHDYKSQVIPIPQNNDQKSTESDFSIDPSELKMRTVREIHVEKPGYGNGNGMVIEEKTEGDIHTVLRKFIENYSAKDYSESDKIELYSEPNRKLLVYSWPKATIGILTSSFLFVSDENLGKNIEAWIKVESSSRNEGWLYIGSRDPYSDNNWSIVGSIILDGKTYHLRKYTSWFSTNYHQPAYDRPNLENSKIIWYAKPTIDNSQINLEPLLITEETFQGKYGDEHWVKAKDAYGRIGWFPGDKLDIERGGFKYHTPENLVKYAFWEP